MPLTQEQITEIQQEAFAEDVPYELDVLAAMSEEDALSYFENGGKLPPTGAGTLPPAASGAYAMQGKLLVTGATLNLATFTGKPSMIMNVASR